MGIGLGFERSARILLYRIIPVLFCFRYFHFQRKTSDKENFTVLIDAWICLSRSTRTKYRCIRFVSRMSVASVKKLIHTACIIESNGRHRHSIIWLHGFGDSAEGCKGLFVGMQPPNTRIVLPNAPKQWVTIEGRQYHTQSWFEHGENTLEKYLPVLESVKELVDNELKLVDNASHIIIGGFR